MTNQIFELDTVTQPTKKDVKNESDSKLDVFFKGALLVSLEPWTEGFFETRLLWDNSHALSTMAWALAKALPLSKPDNANPTEAVTPAVVDASEEVFESTDEAPVEEGDIL